MAKESVKKISELDAQTGVLEVRDATAEEIAAFADANPIDFQAIVDAQAAARESRRVKLLALGLTEEELDA